MITAAGIIAAGDGTRLQSYAPGTPKPLVPVAGQPLIYWTVSSLKAAGIRSITLLHNSRGKAIPEYLTKQFKDIEWNFLQQDTQSSWETFRIVASQLAKSHPEFIMSTADALAGSEDVARFCFESDGAVRSGCQGSLALTSFVEDEKPLWADCGASNRITAMGPEAVDRKYVTCGLYGMTRELAQTFPPAKEYDSLRKFWIASIHEKRRILGIPLSKTVDVDRPEDIPTAEDFIQSYLLRAYASK